MDKPIAITNMYEKSDGTYTDLPLSQTIINTDMIPFAEFVEDVLKYYNEEYDDDRIDIFIDHGTIAKYDLAFDNLNVTLYRAGQELMIRDYTSNYMYTEFDNRRSLWIDLYYSKETYHSDKVFKDILREINNCLNRDLQKYLSENHD